MPARPRTIDEYMSGLGEGQRSALEALRSVVRSVVPGAEECISYGLPAFRWEGRLLVGMGATAGHCALYPMSANTVAAFAGELAEYETSKGTIRFQPEKPLPTVLVRRMVKARMAENRALAKEG